MWEQTVGRTQSSAGYFCSSVGCYGQRQEKWDNAAQSRKFLGGISEEERMRIVRAMGLVLAAAVLLMLHAGAAQATVKTQWVDYKHGDAPLSGYLVYDDAIQGKRP